MKIAKISGEFIWHAHPNTDELFLVLEGDMVLELELQAMETAPTTVSRAIPDPSDPSKASAEENEETNITRVALNKGDVFVVKKGVRHRPIGGEGGASILMMEERGTEALGDAGIVEREIAEGLRREGLGGAGLEWEVRSL